MGTNGNNKEKPFASRYQIDYKDMTPGQKREYYDKLYEQNKVNDKKYEETKRRKKIKKAKNRRRKLIGRITALGLAGIALISGGIIAHNEYEEYQKQNQPAMLEEVLESGGVTLEELAIDSELVSRLEEVQNTLGKEDLTNQQLIRLSRTISNLQFDITKSKLAGVLNVSPDDIKVYYYGVGKDGNNRASVEVYDGTMRKAVYSNKDILKDSYTIPSEVSEMIRDISSMQDVMQQLQDGDFKREDIIKKYQEYLDNTSQFAGMKLQIDKNGNIIAKTVSVEDLDKYDEAVYNAMIKNITQESSSQQQDSTDGR